jgi:hypothetical protein
MKTNELHGAALDWAVAQCEGAWVRHGFDDNCPEYSTEWSQGGPIIEREKIALYLNGDDEWTGEDGWKRAKGPTPLIAAMRCYVAMKMGDEVEVPVELTTEEV